MPSEKPIAIVILGTQDDQTFLGGSNRRMAFVFRTPAIRKAWR